VELLVEIVKPDGKRVGEYVYEMPFATRKQAEAAYPGMKKTFREHLARQGVEVTLMGLA
jgi:hypothetical protein